MAKAKANKRKRGLDPELTRFLLLLAFDEKLSSLYNRDPTSFVDNWPHKLKEKVKTALKSRDSAQIADALISQFGSQNSIASRRK